MSSANPINNSDGVAYIPLFLDGLSFPNRAIFGDMVRSDGAIKYQTDRSEIGHPRFVVAYILS